MSGVGVVDGLSCSFFLHFHLSPSSSDSPAGLFPYFLQGEYSLRRGHGAYGPGSSRAGVALSSILQSPFRRLEDFSLVEACYKLQCSSHLTEFILQTCLSPISRFLALFRGLIGWSLSL